ncbi:MAG: hypothetical protein AAF492_01740 [Verrucomicrobiota bacterium]
MRKPPMRMPFNFFRKSRVKEGIFARIPMPTKGEVYVSPMPYGPYDPSNRLMKLYRMHRIDRAIVLVTDDELKSKAKRDLLHLYRVHGIGVDRYPIVDLTRPNFRLMTDLIVKLKSDLQRDNIAIHCNAGVGRTAIVAACLVKSVLDVEGEEAIDYIMRHMLVNMSEEQKRFVFRWAADQAGLAGGST